MRLSFFSAISLFGIAAANQIDASLDLEPQILAQLEDPEVSIDSILAQIDAFEAEAGSCALVDHLDYNLAQTEAEKETAL